jgi:hypothetical protein
MPVSEPQEHAESGIQTHDAIKTAVRESVRESVIRAVGDAAQPEAGCAGPATGVSDADEETMSITSELMHAMDDDDMPAAPESRAGKRKAPSVPASGGLHDGNGKLAAAAQKKKRREKSRKSSHHCRKYHQISTSRM